MLSDKNITVFSTCLFWLFSQRLNPDPVNIRLDPQPRFLWLSYRWGARGSWFMLCDTVPPTWTFPLAKLLIPIIWFAPDIWYRFGNFLRFQSCPVSGLAVQCPILSFPVFIRYNWAIFVLYIILDPIRFLGLTYHYPSCPCQAGKDIKCD